MPTATPVTVPDTEPTVATEILPLIQVPPDVASDKVIVEPAQMLTGVDGVIAAGTALTVTVAIAKHEPIV